MPDKKYSDINWQAMKPTAHASQLKLQVPLSALPQKYNAKLRTFSFAYPSNWIVKASVTTEGDGVERESGKLYDPSGSVAAIFILTAPDNFVYSNPGNHLASHEISVVVAKPVTVPGWAHSVFYTVIIVTLPNGTFYLVHGLRSQHALYDHVQTFMSAQDEVPSLVADPPAADPSTGFLTFMQGIWSFKSKAEALAYLKTPNYKTIRDAILSASFA